MHAVEFQAVIEDGIVRIPKEYKDLQDKTEVRFLIIYDDNSKYRANIEKKEKKMSAISIDTIGFKFDRDEAHER